MKSVRILLVVAMLVIVAGCGKRGMRTEYVEGKVTLDGQTVEGATVTFRMAKDNADVVGAGQTNAEGIYKLSVDRGEAEAGVPAGEYQVGIRKLDVPAAESNVSSDGTYTPAKASAPGKAPVYKDLVPAKYKFPEKSGLTANVKEGGDNVFNFELTSK
ncbi:MAG: hypothetical protein PHE53_06110 [Thermoguttaceae bacterium]|nr:hypothetical protein [Thermoguttaceae bacterium]